jgi:hypothetical protein
LLGATLPSAPNTDDGTIYGSDIAPAAAPPIVFKNPRLLIFLFCAILFFLSKIIAGHWL